MNVPPSMQTAGIYLLGPEHAQALQILASNPAIAATTRIPHPYPPDAARQFIALQAQERAAGRAHVFVIKNRDEIIGVCGLHGIADGVARELGYWVGRSIGAKGTPPSGLKCCCSLRFKISI